MQQNQKLRTSSMHIWSTSIQQGSQEHSMGESIVFSTNGLEGHLGGSGLLVSAQVMISWVMRSSPMLGSALTTWSLLGTLSYSASPPHLLSLSLFKVNKETLKKILYPSLFAPSAIKKNKK